MSEDQINYEALDRVFAHHAEAVRAAARRMTVSVLRVTEPSREQSLALTKIEEAMFWANAAVARERTGS